MALELERACYDKMERESMEYFYAAEEEIQRQRERIRQLENVLTERLCWPVWLAELLYVPQGCRFRAVRCRWLSGRVSLKLRAGVAQRPIFAGRKWNGPGFDLLHFLDLHLLPLDFLQLLF